MHGGSYGDGSFDTGWVWGLACSAGSMGAVCAHAAMGGTSCPPEHMLPTLHAEQLLHSPWAAHAAAAAGAAAARGQCSQTCSMA